MKTWMITLSAGDGTAHSPETFIVRASTVFAAMEAVEAKWAKPVTRADISLLCGIFLNPGV